MSATDLNWIDYFALGLVGLSTLFGLLRGAVKEIMGLVGWVSAFLLAKWFSPWLSQWLVRWIENPTLRLVAAYVGVFVGVLIVVALFASALSFAVDKTGLGSLNRLLGASFGLVRGYFLFLLLIVLAGFTLIPQQSDWRHSQSVQVGLWGVSHLKPYLPPEVAQFFHI